MTTLELEERLARAARLAHRRDDFSDSESSVATSAATSIASENTEESTAKERFKPEEPPAAPPPPSRRSKPRALALVCRVRPPLPAVPRERDPSPPPSPPPKPSKSPDPRSSPLIRNVAAFKTTPRETPPPVQDEGELVLFSDEDELKETKKKRASLSVSPSLAWEHSLRASPPPRRPQYNRRALPPAVVASHRSSRRRSIESLHATQNDDFESANNPRPRAVRHSNETNNEDDFYRANYAVSSQCHATNRPLSEAKYDEFFSATDAAPSSRRHTILPSTETHNEEYYSAFDAFPLRRHSAGLSSETHDDDFYYDINTVSRPQRGLVAPRTVSYDADDHDENDSLRSLLRRYEILVVQYHRILKEAAARHQLEVQAQELEREISSVQAEIAELNREAGGNTSFASFHF